MYANSEKRKKKRVFNTVLGYCNNKVPAGRELAETPVEGKSTKAASHRASASYSHTVVRCEELGKSQALLPPGYVTSIGLLWFPLRARFSHLWVFKSVQQSSPRQCACEKGSMLWSRGWKHNIGYQMDSRHQQALPKGYRQLKTRWNFVNSCLHTLQCSSLCFSSSLLLWPESHFPSSKDSHKIYIKKTNNKYCLSCKYHM